MKSISQNSKIALIAAICFTLYIVLRVLVCLSLWVNHVNEWLLIFGYIGLTTTLYLRNKKMMLIAACFICLTNLITSLYWLVETSIISMYCSEFILSFLAYAALVLLIFLSSKEDIKAKYFWFLPAVFIVVSVFRFVPDSSGFYYLDDLLTFLFEAIALFFAGLWLKRECRAVQKRPSHFKTESSTSTTSSRSESSYIIGSADKLKALKELLDAGTITQEEFETKKKQILG